MGDQLTIEPRVPTEWQEFTIRYRHGNSTYIIKYQRPETPEATNGQNPTTITLVDDGQEHEVLI